MVNKRGSVGRAFARRKRYVEDEEYKKRKKEMAKKYYHKNKEKYIKRYRKLNELVNKKCKKCNKLLCYENKLGLCQKHYHKSRKIKEK